MDTGTVRNRREFLRRARNVALTTPPTLAVLLVADRHNYAMALSGGGGGGGGTAAEANLIETLFTEDAGLYQRGEVLEDRARTHRQGVFDVKLASTEYTTISSLDLAEGSDGNPLVPYPGLGNLYP